jgi:hypothetical protein
VQHREASQAVVPSVNPVIINVELLEKTLVAGTGKQALESRFGEPITETVMANGDLMTLHIFLTSGIPGNETNVLKGFQSFYTNGCLRRWLPVYGNTEVVRHAGLSNAPARSVVPSGLLPVVNPSGGGLRLFLVTEGASLSTGAANGRLIPNVGNIEDLPGFEINQVTSVQAVQAAGDPSRCRINVDLSRDDIAAFQVFCERHVGRQVVLIFDDVPIAAPLVGTVGHAGSFEFKVMKGVDCDQLVDKMRARLGGKNGGRVQER